MKAIYDNPLLEASRLYEAAVRYVWPVFGEKWRVEAEHAVAGEIHYTDDRFVFIGRSNIDWTGSHINEHIWKERPKRFFWLPALMAGYTATQDVRYLEAARDYLADWMRVHPARPDWSMAEYDNTLNLAIRVAFFAQAVAVFTAWDEKFVRQVLEDINCELCYISANLSPKGNFRMKQAMTLIECGLRLPTLPDAAAWCRLGVAVMNDAARRQVLPDGAHIECTAGYHSWMTELFGDCIRLQRTWPELGFTFAPAMVAKMHDYSLAATKPNGTFCGLHDIEGAYEGSHENVPAKRRAEFCRENGLPDELPATSQVFPSAGQAYLRDGWGEDATYLTFDATRWGGAHCHLSRNAIQVHAFGRSLLVDPGRIAYEMSDPLGPYAKSTRAHNTVNLNGWNQFTTNPDDFRAFHAPGFDCVTARYTCGYWPGRYGWWFFEGLGQGIAATHTRHLFWVHGRWCAVIDEVTRWKEVDDSPSLEINWQFAPGKVVVDGRRAWTHHEDANLLLCVAQAPSNAALEIHEGESHPHRGWVRDFGRFAGRPAPQVSLACRPWTGHMETFVTLLVPYRGADRPAVETSVTGNSLTLAWADGCQETLDWTPGLDVMLGRHAEFDTDGTMLYRHKGATEQAAVVDGTWAEGVQAQFLI